MQKISFNIKEFENISIKPKIKDVYYMGNLELLNRKKISIVGTRRPSNYTQSKVQELSSKLSKGGVVIVSGGAMGVDIIAQGSAFANTISVMPCSLDNIYPKVNEGLLKKIYQEALAISEYEKEFNPTNWSFVARNRLVVALGEVLIIAEADLNSGSLTSAEIAKKLNKEIYVLPHRMGESEGTNRLIKDGIAKVIFDIDEFVKEFADVDTNGEALKDEVLIFCNQNPTYEEAVREFGDKIFEYELLGKVIVENGFLKVNV